MARAIYSDKNIFLMDDVLSAVDVKVGKVIVKNIKRHLSNKIIVLVTHQLQFCKDSDKLVILENGKVKYNGEYKKKLETSENIFEKSLIFFCLFFNIFS